LPSGELLSGPKFGCACIAGYRGNGVACVDVNECIEGLHNCDDRGVCANLVGSFECTGCVSGFIGDGISPPAFLGVVFASTHVDGRVSAAGFSAAVAAAVPGLNTADVHVTKFRQDVKFSVTLLGSEQLFNVSTQRGHAAIHQVAAGMASVLQMTVNSIQVVRVTDVDWTEAGGDIDLSMGRRSLLASSERYVATPGKICGNNFRSFGGNKLFTVLQCLESCVSQRGCHRFSIDDVHQCRIATGSNGDTGEDQCSPISYGSGAILYDLVPFCKLEFQIDGSYDLDSVVAGNYFGGSLATFINAAQNVGPTDPPLPTYDGDTVAVTPATYQTWIDWWAPVDDPATGGNMQDALRDEVKILTQVNQVGGGSAVNIAIQFNTTISSCMGLGNDVCCAAHSQMMQGLDVATGCAGRLLLLVFGLWCEQDLWLPAGAGDAPASSGSGSGLWADVASSKMMAVNVEVCSGFCGAMQQSCGNMSNLPQSILSLLPGSDFCIGTYASSSNATSGNRTGCYSGHLGCLDSSALNFDPAAVFDEFSLDGSHDSCIPKVVGCADSRAKNYQPAANVIDDSCDVDPCAWDLHDCGDGGVCHYVSHMNFTCTCAQGYTGNPDNGTDCTDIDECAIDNGGCDPVTNCTNLPSTYLCSQCPTRVDITGAVVPGYTGNGSVGCVDIDECQQFNGGCGTLTPCINTNGSHTCAPCPSGYTGDPYNGCEDIDECEIDPCMNNALCLNLVGRFVCHCDFGFDGDLCEISIDPCARGEDDCDINANCTHVGPGVHSCQCRVGYSGSGKNGTCTNIDDCLSSPCQYGATCLDGVDAYSCNCTAGFEGHDCEIDINECLSDPCQNGAPCWTRFGSVEPDVYHCTCEVGWEGHNCADDIDECASAPCLNGATCRESGNVKNGTTVGVGAYPYWTRAFPALGTYFCTCTPGPGRRPSWTWSGDFDCAIDNPVAAAPPPPPPPTDDCWSAPCQNGATCVDQDLTQYSLYLCRCAVGYDGDHCEAPFVPYGGSGRRQLNQHSTTSHTTAMYTGGVTAYPSEWKYPNCSRFYGSYAVLPSLALAQGLVGKTFILKDVAQKVALGPGQNSITKGGVRQQPKPHCYAAELVCQHRIGTVVQGIVRLERCTVETIIFSAVAYTDITYVQGGNSEADAGVRGCVDVDECARGEDRCDPQLASCTNTYGNYTCGCNTGFEGDGYSCVDINECANGNHRCDVKVVDVKGTTRGFCTNLPGSYTCACSAGFVGTGWDGDCTNINDCISQPCKNGGRCIDGADSFECICPSSWSGDTCEDSNILDPGMYMTLVGVVGSIGLVFVLYTLPTWVRRKRARVAINDDLLVFERWMHDEHMYRGESAAERAKRAIAEVSRKKKGRVMLAADESHLNREAKLVANTFNMFGGPEGMVYGEKNKHDKWLRKIEARDLDLPQGAVVLDDKEVLQLEDGHEAANQKSQPSTPPTEELMPAAEGQNKQLVPAVTGSAAKVKNDSVDPIRVVAALNRGTRFRKHLHGSMSGYQQESEAMTQYARAMKKLQAEMERREGKADWEGAKRGSERQKVPITIAAGGRLLTKEGNLDVSRGGGGGGGGPSGAATAAAVGRRVAGFRSRPDNKAPPEQ
jgi:hypothetical protein